MSKLVKRLTHACFGTQDIDLTRHFYSEILDFEVIHEFFNEKQELYGLLFLVGEGTFLEFFLEHQPKNTYGYFRHICFTVEGIEDIREKLLSHGFETSIVRGRTDHTLQCWIKGPEGLVIEFHQYDKYSLLTKFQKGF